MRVVVLRRKRYRQSLMLEKVGRWMTWYGNKALYGRCDSRISSFNLLAPGSRPVVAEAMFKSGERCMRTAPLPQTID